jgi:hypothetical protein
MAEIEALAGARDTELVELADGDEFRLECSARA